MAYLLTATAPCNPWVSGKTIRVEAGDRLTVSEQEAQQILNGPYRNRFIVNSSDSQAIPQPLKQIEISSVSDLMVASPTVQEEDIYKTPQVAAPTETKLLSVEAEKDAKEFLDNLIEEPVSAKDAEEELNIVSEEDASEDISSLPEDTHHSKIKSLLLKQETQSKLTPEIVNFVASKFGHYRSIKAECDRILATLENNG